MAAKLADFDVHRVAVRCLGLFGFLERKPSEDLVKQLRCSFVNGPTSVTTMASMAMLDLGLWHGPQEIDKARNQDLRSQLKDNKMDSSSVNWSDPSSFLDIELLDLLYAGTERNHLGEFVENYEVESFLAVIAEGFAKMLLMSEKYPSIHESAHHLLAKLICLYFRSESSELQRLKQCLSVFFDHYQSLSVNHKICLSKDFNPVMRSLWAGINGNAKRSPAIVADMRRRATQASRFMLQMMQAPLYKKETAPKDGNGSENSKEDLTSFESGEEGLAIRIAAEVVRFHSNKSSAEKSYVLALCRILVLLRLNLSEGLEQGLIKLMLQLLNCVAQSVAAEKELVKELKERAGRLMAVDKFPDEKLSSEDANHILGKLELEMNFNEVESVEVPPTPVAGSVRTTRSRRRTRVEESSSSDSEPSPTSVVPAGSSIQRARSQRASKTAAMSKLTAKASLRIDEEDETEGEDGEEESNSGVTSEDDSDVL